MSEKSSISDIGAILKAAREQLGINIASAAMQTNLSSSIISKLEASQFQEIGAPVFTRGYLTQYARFLGLDTQILTNAYNRLGHANTEIRLNEANIASQSRSFKRCNFGAWLVIVPLLILAGVIVLQLSNKNSWLMMQFKHTFLSGNTETVTEINSGEDHQITLQIGDDRLPEQSPINLDNAVTSKPLNTAQLPTLTSLESVDELGKSPVTEQSTTSSVVSNLTNDEQTTDITKTPTTDMVSQQGGQLILTNDNWVEVRNSTNKVMVSRIFKKGEVIELPSSGAPYVLNIGRPNDAKLTINGQTTPLKQFVIKGNTRKFKVEIVQ